jgi:hypothetical protein
LYVFRDDADAIADDLEKTAADREASHGCRASNGEHPLAEQRHERRVVRQNPHLAVERRRDNRVGIAVEHSGLGGNNRDSHHELASFFAFSTASSIPPTM